MTKKTLNTLATLRVALGLVFFWAFVDKLFGLGFATTADKSWLAGGSPTSGFLLYGAKGPFAPLFHALAGVAIVDWLFMVGLCLIGLALILGIGMRVACASGTILLILMYFAVLPPEHHPFLDEHLVYAAALTLLASLPESSHTLGLGRWWRSRATVKRNPWLA